MSVFGVPLLTCFYQGEVAPGAKVYVYQSGTTTPVTTYSNGALSQANAHPIVADSNGQVKFYVAETGVNLRLQIKTAGDVLIQDLDPVYVTPPTFPITDSSAHIKNNSDATKQIRFSAASVGSGQTRVATMPNKNITLAGTDDIVSAYAAVGIDCKNNAGTPNTQFDLDADIIVLRNSSNGTVVRYNPGSALTNDIAQAGPVANGRDQAGAFSAGFVHFYWIWDGTTLATVASASAPPTGPTLPSGYTHWAYAGAVYYDGSALKKVRIKGAWAYYETKLSALAGGSQTSETAVSLANMIPANALAAKLSQEASLTSDGSANIDATLTYRVIANSDYAVYKNKTKHTGNTTAGAVLAHSQFEVPNVAQQVYYLWTVTAGSAPSLDLFVNAYKLPNGGLHFPRTYRQ